ncbi:MULTISPECIES: GntR family transcriptional regulator [unclassified Streptomyces]|uniref:GntR family transcriptional regulator n=1 Tax=unclassified Streptomyces TaxID=2593676 RepID=UPI002DDA1561|nr:MULTISPECIES: GntR family transcriptional regulator [unclassified Streptomyces]WSA91560.1 GntR family transcriptional regulator [Streptomyces sp. NBC_01795]WSS15794.1 GntR family transcriptional regulator [Streptomyces sp. NBC_01186]WSS44633.1 GntR family transcriptional regulator [Streptomyces sp. NBC_01187]
MGNKDETRPVYQRIADDLRRQIDDGTLPVGARIPSRAELKRSYEASDQTVDRAVRVLKSAGYAEGQFGRGVFVTDRAPVGTLLRSTGAVDSPFAARIAARAADPAAGPDPAGAANRAGEPPDERAGPHPVPEPGTEASAVVWEATSSTARAPERIAERLGIGPGDPVMCTQYEYLADRRPVQLATSWEPLAITEGTDVMCPERGPYARRGVRGRLAAIGIRVVRAVELVGARPATSPEAETLGCSPGQCVTAVERTHYDEDGRAVETSDIVVRADRWRLEYGITFTG